MTDAPRQDGLERMLGWVDAIPDQLEAAWQAVDSRGWTEAGSGRGPILLGGMGGSAMAGHLAVALLRSQSPDPCVVQSGPHLPAWVDASTRVIVSSYSGDTWEALALLRAAADRGASLLVITSGGELRREAERRGLPWFELPGGYQPRAALGWLFVPCLVAASPGGAAERRRWGAELSRAAALLREEIAGWRSGRSFAQRDPFELAQTLENRATAILAASEFAEPIAWRWKNQILENAKQAAAAVCFPEAAHNEIMGWEFLTRSTDVGFVLLGTEAEEADPCARTFEAAAEELRRLGGALRRVAPRGSNRLERMLSDVVLGDRLSVELARRRGVDPIPVEAIARLKQACRKEHHG